MKIKRIFILTFLFAATLQICLAQGQSIISNNKIEANEIKKLIGTWKGSLTYVDYRTNKPYSMPCTLDIITKKENRKFILKYTYPNEPKANSSEQLKFSKDLRKINGKIISQKLRNAEDNVELTTSYNGKDGNDNKKAAIRNIYIVGEEIFIIRKEVKFEGSEDWIKRSEYDFQN